MILATKEDFEQVKSIFYKHKKWFTHVRTDYMMRMIDKQQLILEEGILIIFITLNEDKLLVMYK